MHTYALVRSYVATYVFLIRTTSQCNILLFSYLFFLCSYVPYLYAKYDYILCWPVCALFVFAHKISMHESLCVLPPESHSLELQL